MDEKVLVRPRPILPVVSLVLVVVIAASACSGAESPLATEATETTAASATDVTAEVVTATEPSAEPAMKSAVAPTSDSRVLSEREGPRRETSGSVPHVQLDAVPVAEVDAELRRRAFLLPGVEDRQSTISLPGARGLWLSEDTPLVRGDILPGGREFAHIHPDGSLHVWLDVRRALEVHETKWGEFHPWVDRDGFWDGVVMIYTPETAEELDTTIRLLVDAYNLVTGASVDPTEI